MLPFYTSLLCVLYVQCVTAETGVTPNDNNPIEYDDFIPYSANPVKDVFDWRLLQKFTLAKGHSNVILSPISLKLVLALLYEGSAGLTDKEFRKVLNFTEDKKVLREDFNHLLDTLVVKRDSYIINIGTTIFLDAAFTPLPTYQTKAQVFYHTDVVKSNFTNPNEASTNINTWVEYLTNGRIKSFVNPDDIENAVMLAVNAVYFKGMWSIPFLRNETFTGNFYAQGKQLIQTQYMKLTEKFYYFNSKSLEAELLRIPYKGRKFALYIVLPHSNGGLSHLIDNLDLQNLTMSVRFMDAVPVQVILPKFRFDFQARYSKILREFGFENLFTSAASFPGIVRDQNAELVVTDILQKSGIDVNEEGSIVYTTTQVTIGNKFGGESVTVFNASRPFLFFVQEETTKNIIFLGKVENPLEMHATPLPPRYGGIIERDPPAVPLSTVTEQPPGDLSNSQFDIGLLKNSIGTSKNIFISPASVKVSLAMLAEASSGQAADEIYTALRIPKYQREYVLLRLINELSETYPSSILEFKNALFVSEKAKINQQFKSVVEGYYRALIKQVNYTDKDKAASVINNFVKEATRGFISKIISGDEINPQTKVILTNALYFKAVWETVFDKKWTRPACFHTPRRCVTVPLMQVLETFGYGQTQHAQLVQLNYSGNTRAMLLVVPKNIDGLSAALHDLDQFHSFDQLVASLNQTEVEVYLPRFDIDYTYDLKQTLQKMNVKEIFSGNANLSNLFESGSSDAALVDSFKHKAKVEVNEEGTKASAVSLVSVIPLMGISTPKIRADRPFAFFIFNTQTNTILFEGMLNEPDSSEVRYADSRTAFTSSEPVKNQLPSQQIQDEQQLYRVTNANRF